ncbi:MULTISPECIES: AAA family ATPase [unclassified Bradyrhizobium]|uniref:AAA family ATPase n=1 Tax=unclassified Bradyrhizobium TaxID=2631580 RepID=UPI001CD391D0|nr:MULTISPECIES: AAA family ATPase [unclassified Bradyrhizobium]MCA1474766.1 AAA family ATPase [Bradyrhizobium sp. NBAIM08]MCA1514548.1 AAA family ATPase [Bradyrhizobium sp. NBAIM01]
MSTDANGYARANGPAALRQIIDGTQPAAARGWHFLTEHKVSAPRMLIKGIAPYRGILFIGGQSGAGKTFMACHMANSLASASPFFERAVKERVASAIVSKEGTENIGNRLTADAQARGLDINSLPIAWRGDLPEIKTAEDVDRVARELLELADKIKARFGVRCGASFFDTIAANFHMEDENSNAEIAKVIGKLREFEERTTGLVIPVHHYGKQDAAGLRGGSLWRGGADVVLSVLADRDDRTGKVSGRELALAKARDGLEGPIAPFELKPHDLGIDDDGEPFGSLVVVPGLAGQSAIRVKPPKAEAKSKRVFREAVAEAIAGTGRDIRVLHDGPMVRATEVENVRTQFYRRYVTGEAEPGKVTDARQKAFKRLLNDLPDGISASTQDGAEWLWRVDQ